jgi:hypothetical protein
MPPHCDTRDGPVVKAARKALETGKINYILIWIPEESEPELHQVFDRVLRVRRAGKRHRKWLTTGSSRLQSGCTGQERVPPIPG